MTRLERAKLQLNRCFPLGNMTDWQHYLDVVTRIEMGLIYEGTGSTPAKTENKKEEDE